MGVHTNHRHCGLCHWFSQSTIDFSSQRTPRWAGMSIRWTNCDQDRSRTDEPDSQKPFLSKRAMHRRPRTRVSVHLETSLGIPRVVGPPKSCLKPFPAVELKPSRFGRRASLRIPCGLNEVVRIQKFVQGGHVALHTDRPIRLEEKPSNGGEVIGSFAAAVLDWLIWRVVCVPSLVPTVLYGTTLPPPAYSSKFIYSCLHGVTLPVLELVLFTLLFFYSSQHWLGSLAGISFCSLVASWR